MEKDKILNFSKNFSLLWPETVNQEKYKDNENLSRKCIENLGIKQIAEEISYDERHYYTVRKLLVNLCDNTKVIKYRLDILEDFVENPKLINSFKGIFELIEQIRKYEKPEAKMENDKFVNIAWRLKMLDIYVECMEKLYTLFNSINNFQSRGLNKLFNFIEEVVNSDLFQSLQNDLPELKEKFDNLSCVTIGINLNAKLQPEEAVFLSIEPERFQKEIIFFPAF